MKIKIALMTALPALLWMAASGHAQTTQPASPVNTAGEPLQPSPPPPAPSATTDNAPRGMIPDPTGPLVREGTHINRHTGHLSHSADDQQAIFTFDPDDKGMQYPPMIVLPNLKLWMIEGAVTSRNNDFPVSGTVTEYKGRNYILLDNVPHGTVPDRPAAVVRREGMQIINRSGRLSHAANGQGIFTFDSDGKTEQDAPLLILPNLKLQTMENTVIGLSKDVHFRISGTITEYKGKNFILLDKAVAAPDVDQQM